MKVLLVDDYPLILDGLLKVFDWAENGFSVVARAGNGKQALDILEKQPVDIIFSDIKMPIMDGLELIKIVTKKYPLIKIAVLSAYDDFQLVRTAFQLGADDYLLKQEMDSQTIKNICEKFRENIEIERSSATPLLRPDKLLDLVAEKEALEKASVQNRVSLQESFFRKLVAGGEKNSDAVEKEQLQLHISFKNKLFSLVLLKIEHFNPMDDIELLSFTIEKSIRKLLENDEDAHIFSANINEYNIVYSGPDTDILHKTAARLFEAIHTSLSVHAPVILTGGVSTVFNSLAELQTMHQQARAACEYRFAYGKGSLIFYSDIPVSGNDMDKSFNERLRFLLENLQNRKLDTLLNSIHLLTLHKEQILPGNIRQVIQLYYLYTWSIINFIENQNLPIDCGKLFTTFQLLSNNGTITELNSWLRDTLESIAGLCENHSKHFTLFCQYVSTHFGNCELKISDIADSLGISVGYLGKLIYKETKHHFSDFLNSYRIERSKEFLTTTTLKIYEISERTGYNNVEHFTRVFKKITGISPMAYANLHTKPR